jgi:hypothetical protein
MRLLVLGSTIVCLILIGCTRNEPSGPTRDSGPDGIPTGPPHGGITLTSGSARISLTGELEAEESFEGVSAPAIYRPIPATVTVTWAGDKLVIAGPLRFGAQTTSEELSLRSTLEIEGRSLILASTAGECLIDVEEADERSFSGSFFCRGLVAGDSTVDASGSFQAAG